jgi:hypothetical protein
MGTRRDPEQKPSQRDEKAASQLADERFIEGLVARGEAANADDEGRLPPGATHEIVEERDGKPTKVRRRRFSLR